MVITDLDGTIAPKDLAVSAKDVATLHALGERGIVRAVATGRSVVGTRKVLPPDFPIDYLIFSTGAGVLDWRTGELLRVTNMSAEDMAFATSVLIARRLDFMVHRPIPNNHEFVYYESGNHNPDFVRRREKHVMWCRPWDGVSALEGASQLLVIDPIPQSSLLHEELNRLLPAMNLIRATSPLDDVSAWIEVFSRSVSKSLAAQWLAARCGRKAEDVLAVGNDFNDVDLLHWAGTPFVVDNAPAHLHAAFPSVADCRDNGFSEAVSRWLSAMK